MRLPVRLRPPAPGDLLHRLQSFFIRYSVDFHQLYHEYYVIIKCGGLFADTFWEEHGSGVERVFMNFDGHICVPITTNR